MRYWVGEGSIIGYFTKAGTLGVREDAVVDLFIKRLLIRVTGIIE